MIRNNKYVYTSKSVSIPAHIHFGQYMMEKFWKNKEIIALINGTTNEITKYGQLAQEATNIAVSLTRLGVGKGDAVAIMSENRHEYFSIFVGIAYTGAVVTPINQLYTEGELKHTLSISKPNYLFCTSTTYKSMEKEIKAYKRFKKIIIIDDEKISETLCYKDLATVRGNCSTCNGSSSTNKESSPVTQESSSTNGESRSGNKITLTKNYKLEEIDAAVVQGQTDTVVILYSSGTTGFPKGVMLTHHNLITMCSSEPLDFPDGVVLTIGMWFHAMGLVGSFCGFVGGKSFAFLPKFDIDSLFRTIERYKVEMLLAVPAVVVALSKSTSEYDFSSVRRVLAAAAPIHKDTLHDFAQKYPNVTGFTQGYGMTEFTLAIARNRFDGKTQGTGSVGKVVPQAVLKIVDPDTRVPLGPNQSGEICVKGEALMKGYVGKDPREYLDNEGFFLTGDVGYYDTEGYLYIVDRLKELIKYKGNQVAPAELEALLLQHDAVKEVAVVGLLDKEAGELPMAFVVLQPHKSATEKEIRQFVAEKVSNPKHLRGGVRFIDEIPKNAIGKIQRQILKHMANGTEKKF